MAAKGSCSITYNVRDMNGKPKVSALWKDLTKVFSGDRRQTMIHYLLSKDGNFLSDNVDTLEFDVDGEVTIESLKRAMDGSGIEGNLSNSVVLTSLNKELGAGRYEYDEALSNVLRFNKGNQFAKGGKDGKGGFMATLTREADGYYSIKVVPRTSEEEYKLADHVQNKLMTDAVITMLENMGLSTEFLRSSRLATKYSTQNPVQDADGLYKVVSVLNGENTAPEVAEAAGHFIVGAMADNPNVRRVVDMLSDLDLQQALFKNEASPFYREGFIVSSESAEEAAGILIGEQLLTPFKDAQNERLATERWKESWKGWTAREKVKALWQQLRNLLGRIARFVGERLGVVKPSEVRGMVESARLAASTAAMGFLSNPEAANPDAALASAHTYVRKSSREMLSEATRTNVDAYRDTIARLKALTRDLKPSMRRADDANNKEIYAKLKDLIANVEGSYGAQLEYESLARTAAIEGIAAAIVGLEEILSNDVSNLLDSINPASKVSFYNDITRNFANMKSVCTAMRNISDICGILSDKLAKLHVESVTIPGKNGNPVAVDLREALDRLNDVLSSNGGEYADTDGKKRKMGGLQQVMEAKMRQMVCDVVEEFYGAKYVDVAAGKVWVMRKGKMPKLVTRSEKRMQIADFVDSLEEDISWFDRYMSSAADCGDFMTAVGYKVSREANMVADRTAMSFWHRLDGLRTQMKTLFGDTDCGRFFELAEEYDEDGNPTGRMVKTGNLISETGVNYGAWERDRKLFKKDLDRRFNEYLAEKRKKFYEENKGAREVYSLTQNQIAMLRYNFVEPLWNQWHKEHSEKDASKRWIPKASKYHNPQWDELFDTGNPGLSEEEVEQRKGQLVWYKHLLEVKSDMDGLLPAGATVPTRAPQMVGRFSHRIENLRQRTGEGWLSAGGRILRMKVAEMWNVRDDEGYLFGTNNEFNELEEDPTQSPAFYEKESRDRLPVFGVNKLRNMDDLSTDLFGTMMAYGSMASSFFAMKQYVDVFGVAKDVLKRREVAGVKESERPSESRAYGRFIKFIEKNVYGINVTPPKFGKNGFIKFLNSLSALGSRILLGGNVAGGIVNTGTGINEILKEALAGEHFGISDVNAANKLYFSNVIDSFVQGYKQRKDDKVSLWIRHWNILGENRDFLRGQSFDQRGMFKNDYGIWRFMDQSLMLPYSTGDHYMQTIPYFALANTVTVYDSEGNPIKLMDAYSVVDGEEVFRAEESGIIEEILRKTKAATDMGTLAEYTDEELEFLAANDLEGESPKAIMTAIKKRKLGNTPKRLVLRDDVFRGPEEILKYRKAIAVINKISDIFERNPNIKNSHKAHLELTDDEIKYLEEEGFLTPSLATAGEATAKELASLKTALTSKTHDYHYNEDDESMFMDKARNITNRLHGIYNQEDKVVLQQNIVGNLWMAMKGYALGMVNRRFGNNRYNIFQQRNTEGTFNTALKVMASIRGQSSWKAAREGLFMGGMFTGIPVTIGEWFFAGSMAVPLAALAGVGVAAGLYGLFNRKFQDKVRADMMKEGFSETQFYNMKRMGTDFLLIEALMLLKMLLAPNGPLAGDDDDSESNIGAGIAYYFVMRWLREQSAFNTLRGIDNEMGSMLDWKPIGLSGSFTMLELGALYARTAYNEAFNNSSDKYKNSDLYYQSSKEGMYEAGDMKAWKKTQRLIPYYRSFYTFQHPYEAASGYEYGRKIR